MKIKCFFVVLILCLSSAQPANASYDFAGNADLTGTFSSQYGQPLTLACQTKQPDVGDASDGVLALAETSAQDPHMALKVGGADKFNASVEVTAGVSTAFHISSVGEYDNTWVPWVGVFTSNTSRDIYVELITNTDGEPTSRVMSTTLDFIRIGEAPNGGGGFDDKIAECAIWDVALSTTDITSYLNGTCAAEIDAANLIGYWPMDTDNSTQSNEGLDAGGDLTVTIATFVTGPEDHPTITCGGATTLQRRRMQ